MKDFYSIVIDKSLPTPLYIQLGDGLRELIEGGVFPPNEKLPPIRKMADSLKVNSATVVSAYKYLENRKVVYSKVGSGTYVSPIPIGDLPKPADENRLIKTAGESRSAGGISFLSTSLPESLFPAEDFKEVFNELLEAEKGGAFRHLGGLGYEPLRESICEYLLDYNIKTTPDNIQIISGAQQGIDIVSKALMSYGDTIFVESPTFYGAAAAFISRGGRLIEIPLEADGIDIAALENLAKLYHPKFIYVMVYFQTPSGVSYSTAKKRALLELADKYGFYIIEDDNLYDFNYTDSPTLPLKALDYKNRVVYIKSFSKILMPGLRIGFIVIPKRLMEPLLMAKYTADISTSGFIQKSLNQYFRLGGWRGHLDRVKEFAKSKYKTAVSACELYIEDYAEFTRPGGGISLWLDIGRYGDSAEFARGLAARGVYVAPEQQFMLKEGRGEHIRLCFSSVSDEAIYTGIKGIRDYIKGL